MYLIFYKKIKNPNIVKKFLKKCKNSLKTFKYFDKRKFEIIKHHKITLLMYVNFKAVAYAHINFDNWFGVCVSDKKKGMGYGNKILNKILKLSKKKGIKKIFLSVYKKNLKAINLYKKNNFIIKKNDKKNLYMFKIL